MGLLVYFVIGTLFGIGITKSEIVSWFRIQEMFRFQGIEMYALFATAMPVAIITVQIIKRRQLRTLDGVPVAIPAKQNGTRYISGGILFGIGWALTGACPGPLFALVGSGATALLATLAAALLGTWTYGRLRHVLPH